MFRFGEHPRSRGENWVCPAALIQQPGTSPLARGKLCRPVVGVGCVGNIPARAGKTACDSATINVSSEHPRSRGENNRNKSLGSRLHGTSPLARGKHRWSQPLHGEAGNIPARAGKTSPVLPVRLCRREHPRSRGENKSNLNTQGRGGGTSPLARGKLGSTTFRESIDGNIPARAGKTGFVRRFAWRLGEHPRSRGENLKSISASAPVYGTSPLARGKHELGTVSRFAERNIPARAGKTPAEPDGQRHCWEHPRSRGENLLINRISGKRRGTSPLARGKLRMSMCSPIRRGNIPARAGKTGFRRITWSLTAEHPRSRGENAGH